MSQNLYGTGEANLPNCMSKGCLVGGWQSLTVLVQEPLVVEKLERTVKAYKALTVCVLLSFTSCVPTRDNSCNLHEPQHTTMIIRIRLPAAGPDVGSRDSRKRHRISEGGQSGC